MNAFFLKKKRSLGQNYSTGQATVPCVRQQDPLFKFLCVGNFPDYIVMREMRN
jgi:hypothetical protein